MFSSTFISDECGAAAIEYALIIAVVAFGLVLIMHNLGPVIILFIHSLDAALQSNVSSMPVT